MSANAPARKTYVVIWAILMALLFLTWAVAQLNLGLLNPVAAVVIAVVKMALVMLFFMHLRYNRPLTWVFAGAGFVWFTIMVSFTLSDYLMRGAVRTQNSAITFDTRNPPNHPPEQNSRVPNGASR